MGSTGLSPAVKRRKDSGATTWETYISEDLRAKICEGRELPRHVTLQGLSEAYGVSITPVRRAVETLLDEDLLTKQSNGRIIVNPEKIGSATGASDLRPQPPIDHYAAVANELVQQSLCDQETEIREREIAERHGIGTRRVREILNRLAGVGMVRHLPRRGWRLAPFDEQSLKEYMDVRLSLEMRALELAMPYVVRADLDRIRRDNLLQGTSDTPLIIDDEVHRYIVEKANNRYITAFFEQHQPYYKILLDFESQHPDILELRQRAVSAHVSILDAMIRSDLSGAKAALKQDLTLQHPLWKI